MSRGRWIPSAVDRLLDEPQRHGFFQAMRLLERWLMRSQGLSADQALARIRFRSSLQLRFAPAEIDQLRQISGSECGLDARDIAFELEQPFFGFTGAQGALPIFYTELLLANDVKQGAARAFLDLFLQRATTLLYQGWRKQRLGLRHEQQPGQHYLQYLSCVAGMGLPGQAQALSEIGDEAPAYFAQILQRRTLNSTALARLLSHYFGVPVQVEGFVGHWVKLEPSQQSMFGAAESPPLGQGALLGARLWQRDQRVRLRIGPLDHAGLQRFLPGGRAAIALQQWLKRLSGHSLSYEVRLRLRAADVRGACLGVGARLNQDCFLLTRAAAADRDDPGYTLLAA